MFTNKKKKIILIIEFILLILFLFTIGSGNVVSPIYGDIDVLDEGQYGAWLMHLFNGGYLYKDTYAAYGPLYIYPLYILAHIFTPTAFLIRVLYIVIDVFFAVIIVQLLLRELKIPYILQLFCIFMLLVVPGLSMRQGMGFLTLLFAYYAVEKKKYSWSVATGIMLALAFLTSSDIGIFSTFVCLFYFLYSAILVKDIRQYIKKILFIIISYSVTFFIFYLWSASQGWFYSYIYSIFNDLIIYSSIAIPIGENFPNALHLMPHSFSLFQWIKFILSQQMFLYWLYLLYIISFIYFFVRIVLKKFAGVDNLILLITLFGFLLSTILIGRTDHLGFTLPPAFMLFAYYSAKLISIIKGTNRKSEIVVSVIVMSIIIIFSVRLLSIYRPHFNDISKIPKAVATNNRKIPYVGPIAISKKQANSFLLFQHFVRTHTKKQDDIFILSNDPMLYFLADKVSPTKYDLPEVANTKSERLELLGDLEKSKPKYIFYDLSSYSVDGVSNYVRLPEVISFIKRNYTQKRVGNYIVYSFKK